MFKKPPTLKPSTPLRSSSRRAFLAHLQSLYPVLASASVEKILQVVPIGLKQCNAITSANQKAVIYTDEKGKPLWFELGPNAGAALQQSQKKSNQASQLKLAEVFPTVFTLWFLPSLLPRLPTWPQVMDPTLLSGSALMIPGLIPPPDTFPEGQVDDGMYPPSSSIISITAYPSSVPMVVARSEIDMREMCQKRASGGKGKAATAVHMRGDFLWEMGGKLNPPSQDEVQKIEEELASAKVINETQQIEEQIANLTVDGNTDRIAALDFTDAGSIPDVPVPEINAPSGPAFTVAEVDKIMHLALLQSLANLAKQQDQLPMPISSLYSSQVLSNRPAHWPPRDLKGRKSSRLPRNLVEAEDNNAEKLVNVETVDIKRTSEKKLSRWIKNAEKNELLKCKDVKGKDTVVTWVSSSHVDLQSLSPYYTISQSQRDSSTSTSIQKEEKKDTAPSKMTVVVIEKFWKASASSIKLFQEMGATTSEPLSLPIIRGYLHDYITSHNLVDAKNQAQIKLHDPILVHALYPKAKLVEIPASLSRQELIDRLVNTSCVEYHRTSRLSPEKATQIHLANTKGKPIQDGGNGVLGAGNDSEYIGAISVGPAKSVVVEIKSRQGRKAVSLITGLETFGIDPQALAHDLMKLGASASATALPSSTLKNPKMEVFVQGDQRKAIYDFIERHGLDRRFVQLHDSTKK